MRKRKISMKKVREIIRLDEDCKLSQRQISKALSLSRPMVSEYLRKIKASGLKYKEIQAIPDDALLEILNTRSMKNEKREKLQSKFGYFTKELKSVGVTRYLLWEEYIRENPGGYSYSQFCYHFHEWEKNDEISMHIEHKAGDKLFVDYTGKKLNIVNTFTGEFQEVEVFVAVLGASQLTYVEAVKSQKKEDWILATENSLRYIKGVPRAIVPDNLKSAVTKADKYEPEINPEYQDFARHYNTAIIPARPYKPKDKAMVEGAVRIVYSWIFARIRDEVFHSLDQLNARIKELLDEYNNRKMQKLGISRRELFTEVEEKELLPLPVEKYTLKHYKRLKVQFNYHIYLNDDKHYYSVPYRYKGKHVDVLYTDRTVEIYHNNTRVAIHGRNCRKNGYTTKNEHMHPHHRYKDNWNPEKLINWGEGLGPSVKAVIEAVLQSSKHPEQNYKTCLGILHLKKEYGKKRLEKACCRALFYDNYSYRFIKNILVNKLEGVEEVALFEEELPSHENIRGNNYYTGEENEQPVYN
jgi:transposase